MEFRKCTLPSITRLTTLLLLCLTAIPCWAKQAQYADGVLSVDTLNYNNVTYQVQLAPIAGSNPIAFSLRAAQAVASTTDPAATLFGTTLTIPNVLINGTERLSVKMLLTGVDPVRFQLQSYSTVRSVTLDTADQALTQGKAFYVKYSGSALTASKIKLNIGSLVITPQVIDNVIATIVPFGIQGSQTLSIELDGDAFLLPLKIEPGTPIANPKTYVSNAINEIAVELQRLALPADLLDQKSLSSQLAALTEAEAQQAALLIRENMSALSGLSNELNGRVMALSMFTPTGNLGECERLMVNYLRATSVMSLSMGVVVVGGIASTALPLSGPFALAAAVATASAIVSGELAVQYQGRLLTLSCLQVESATIGTVQPVRSDVTVTQTLNVFESRAQSINITEMQGLASQEVRSDFLSASAIVKTSLDRLNGMLTSLGFSSSNRLVSSVKNLLARLKTNDRQQVTDNAHKFVIRAVSDSRVSASLLPSSAGTLTLLLDRKDTDMPEGQSISFTIELYNSADDITIKVPIKLSGASMLEDLKLAAVGEWSVTRADTGHVYALFINADGNGYYKAPVPAANYICTGKGTLRVGEFCHYPISWSVYKTGTQYFFAEAGFWHPGYNVATRTPITLPLTGFYTFDPPTPDTWVIRYIKH